MPATFTPISNEVLAGVKQGDEHALEQLFREHYDALLEEARGHLDEGSFAPRVVETAILRAWEQHGSFETPMALEMFLHQAVREGAIRDKSRRAALHRFEAHEHVKVAHHAAPAAVTTDEAWRHVSAAIHAPVRDASQAAEAKAQLSRHAAAEHMATVARKSSPWLTLAYLGGALLVAGGMMWAIFRESPAQKVTRFLNNPETRDIATKFGQIGAVTLDDQSTARVGADSHLLIPPGFATEVRGVRVVGTAAFEVAPAGTLPFEVRLGEVAVIATGTKFAVNFDTTSHTALVRVDEGAVSVRHGESTRSLAAGQALEVDREGAMREPDATVVREMLSWLDGRLVISNRPLRQALEQTRRWYGVGLVPAMETLLERTVSVDAPLDTSKAMIADLEESGKLKFGWKDETMVLYDASAAPPARKR